MLPDLPNPALPNPGPSSKSDERTFGKVVLRLVKRGPERRALEAGQIDAILDPTSGKAVLMPESYRATPDARQRFTHPGVAPGTDNTTRQQTEAALLKSGALQNAIFNSANFSYIATDAKGVIQIFSAGAERMLGYAATDVVNRITPADISDSQEVVARAKTLSLELGAPIAPGFEALVFKASRGIEDIYELTYIRKDGSRFPAVVSVTALCDAEGAIIGYLLIGADNTARQQAAEVFKDNDRRRDRRKDEFLATLAHELRNPLAPISNALHLLRLSGGNEPIHEILERQVKHMVRLVDDLMEVSRISRDKIELRRERITLASVVKHALETSQPLIEAGGQRLTVVLPPTPLVLDADPVRLTQVLTNLLNNAAKYTPANGHVWLSAWRDEDWVAISVRDNGVGIPADMLSRVFEMFTQVDRTLNRAQGGLGIGLSLVRRLVGMHGGQVTAGSDGLDRGSEFIVRLPLAEDIRNQEPAADSLPIPHSKLRPAQSVLVVDDNHDAADSLGLLLKVLGSEVQVAHSGASALAALDSFRPSVVLLDLGMPGMDGYEVARRMRATHGAELTLIALTGWGQEEDRRRTHAAGFDHHLTKPPDLAALQVLLASL